MISGLSSSVFGAIRTATAARATMDDATRQIATGKRVASVKDDGAAWARAAEARADRVTVSARRDALDRVSAGLSYTAGVLSVSVEQFRTLRELTLTAQTSAPGSDARHRVQAEWDEVTEWSRGAGDSNPLFTPTGFMSGGGSTMGYQIMTDDGADFSGSAFAIIPTPTTVFNWLASTVHFGVALRGADIVSATSAQLATLHDAAAAWERDTRERWLMGVGLDQDFVERAGRAASRDLDRLDASIGALTDADLGRASTARAQAETRQALAMQTVRAALDAYSAKATGLLANVQRTQRSVLA